MHADKREEIKEVSAGDIAAFVGLKDTGTGDTLADQSDPVVLERMAFPIPVIDISVEPKTKDGVEKMTLGLQKLAGEDPSLRLKTDQETGQTILSGMGELHLEIIIDRLKREYGVDAHIGAPQVAYRETIIEVPHRDLYPQEAVGRLGPVRRGEDRLRAAASGTRASSSSTAPPAARCRANTSRRWRRASRCRPIPACSPASRRSTSATPWSTASTTTSTSSALAFEIAAKACFREGMKKAGPVILEPIMDVEVTTPQDHVGDVVGDLNRRRGVIQSQDMAGTSVIVRAHVPLKEMFGYISNLRGMTKGRASFSMQFHHYDPVPRNIADEIMAKSA